MDYRLLFDSCDLLEIASLKTESNGWDNLAGYLKSLYSLQTERGHSVQLTMEQFRLPCVSQSLRVRDGDSSSAQLLAHLTGTPQSIAPVISTTSSLLIEFTAGDIITSGDECSGGFLAHASQIGGYFCLTPTS